MLYCSGLWMILKMNISYSNIAEHNFKIILSLLLSNQVTILVMLKLFFQETLFLLKILLNNLQCIFLLLTTHKKFAFQFYYWGRLYHHHNLRNVRNIWTFLQQKPWCCAVCLNFFSKFLALFHVSSKVLSGKYLRHIVLLV